MRQCLRGGLAGISLAIALTGCNSHATGPKMAQQAAVHGKISFQDKTPLKGGMIMFTPQEIEVGDGSLRYECGDVVDAKGNYTIGFNSNKQGAPPGRYWVTITPRDDVGSELKGNNVARIPQKYQSATTTPLVKDVKEGDNQFDFELTK
jgi:hypothetical protein